MPQRFLKPGIAGSPRWNACSYIGQSFFIRLLTLVDDFGRYEVNPRYLASVTFPLSDDVDAAKITELLAELQQHELIQVYNVHGKDFLQINTWTERSRAPKSKYPRPPTASEPTPSAPPCPAPDSAAECCQPDNNPQESGAESCAAGSNPQDFAPFRRIPQPPSSPSPSSPSSPSSSPTTTHHPPGAPPHVGSYAAADPPPSSIVHPASGIAHPASSNAPPSLDEVKTLCAIGGIPPNVGEIWWNEHDARPRSPRGMFTDRNGLEVERWQSALKAYAEKWRANAHEKTTRNGRAGPDRAPPLWQQIRDLELQISLHPANWESTAYNREHSPEQKADFQAKYKRLLQLKRGETHGME